MNNLLNRFLRLTAVFSWFFFCSGITAQPICNTAGNLMIFSNYDGGTLTVNCDQNITNLKIGVCSYEGVMINLTGPFVGNVTGVCYAGYNGANVHCTYSINTSINGAPPSATTAIIIQPVATLTNSNGYGNIICAYSCNNGSSQGGCNTVDQVENYFLSYFSGSALLAHKVQYGCWTGTQSLSVGGTCCPPIQVIPGGISASQSICPGQVPSALVSTAAATGGSGTITYTWQSSASPTSGFTNIGSTNTLGYSPPALATTTYYRRTASTSTNNISYSNVVAITVYPSPNIQISGPPGLCPGNTGTYVVTGGSSYTWTPGGSNFSAIALPATSAPVTLSIVANNTQGCTGTSSKQVSLFNAPNISVTGPASVCPGALTNLTAAGAANYTWQPGPLYGAFVSATSSSGTIFSITATDANGCTGFGSYTLGVFVLPNVIISSQNTMACVGQTVTLNASGATTYTWAPGNITNNPLTFTASSSKVYTVTGKDQNGCSAKTTFSLTVNTPPVITLSIVTQPVCSGKPAQMVASGATSYTWMPGALSGATISPSLLSTNVFSVTGDDGYCTGNSNLTVNVVPSPTVQITTLRSSICEGESTKLTASGAATYSWITPTGSSGSTFVTVNPLITSGYSVTGAATNGCEHTANITVTVNTCSAIREGEMLRDGLFIYPNPTEDEFTIRSNFAMEVWIIDNTLKKVAQYSLNDVNGFKKVIKDLSPGIYFVGSENKSVPAVKLVVKGR
jgi:hypothetical protein